MKTTYIKLYFAAVAAAAIITILLITFFFVRFQERRLSVVNPREAGMAMFLVREIDQTPSQETVDRLAENFHVHIRVEAGDRVLMSDADYFQSPGYAALERRERPGGTVRRDRRHRDVTLMFDGPDPVGFEVVREGIRYIFVRDTEGSRVQRVGVMVALLVVLVLSVLGFLVKRWLGDPLRELERSIRRFSGTELPESKVPASGELKRLFDAFEEMKQQVRETLADKERLLRDVSHDLKSPITRLRVAVEMIPSGAVRDRMTRDLDELTGLVDHVLDSQHVDVGHLEPLDMVALLEDYLERHTPAIPVRLNIRHRFRFQGEREQMHRVLNNLVDNSWKYADRKAGIDITIDRDEVSGLLLLADHGETISQDVVDRMFEPFYKGDPSRRQDVPNGSGLGLAICRRIVGAMGGAVRAHSPASGGLIVEIRLPLTP